MKQGRRGFTLVEIMIVVAIIGLLAAVAIPNMMRSRQTAQTTRCIDNLRMIDEAKQQWAMATGQPPAAKPNPSDIQPYLGRGANGKFPVCPIDTDQTSAASYNLNDCQTPPTCTIDPANHHLQ